MDTDPFGFELSKAIHDFELANPKDEFHYESVVSNLNRKINLVINSEYFHDNQMIKELNECRQKRTELENTIKEKDTEIRKLTEEKFTLKGELRVYERDMPKSDTLIGDTSD